MAENTSLVVMDPEFWGESTGTERGRSNLACVHMKRGKKEREGKELVPEASDHVSFVPAAVAQSGQRRWTSNSWGKETDSSRPRASPSSPRALLGGGRVQDEILDDEEEIQDERGVEPAWAGASHLLPDRMDLGENSEPGEKAMCLKERSLSPGAKDRRTSPLS